MFLFKCLLTGDHKTGAPTEECMNLYLCTLYKRTDWPGQLADHKMALCTAKLPKVWKVSVTPGTVLIKQQANVEVSPPPPC